MLLHIALAAEIFAIILFMYVLAHTRFRMCGKVVVLASVILLLLEMINFYRLSGIYSLGIYIILCLYGKWEFKKSIVRTVGYFLMTMVFITLTQFIVMTVLEICIAGADTLKTAICNVLVLLLCIAVSVKSQSSRLPKDFGRDNIVLLPIACFVCVVVVALLLQKKLLCGVRMQSFVLTVPALILLVVMTVKWLLLEQTAKDLQAGIKAMEAYEKSYRALLLKVRERQHEFKNHMAAVFSSHYTYKTYEQLVKAQEEYCNKILDEHKYHQLLLMGESVLPGFLHEKFQEAETEGIAVAYTITTQMNRCSVPVYHVVEMLGILLDNAVEELRDSVDGIIRVSISETEDSYLFTIQNPHEYVSYEEIAEWFVPDKSDKGTGRGVGLYHLKNLCEEWSCDIGCKNVDLEECNWIEFTLRIGKAENE